jgi:uncharacterized membrane protein YkvA (DUF1232 family)
MCWLPGSTFVGLTDNPIRRRAELGDPPDWRVEHWFRQESDARAWEQVEVRRPSHRPAPEGPGWRFGYKFTLVDGGASVYARPVATNLISDVVRRMVDGFSADVEAVQVGVIDGRTPEAARRVLAAGLVYLAEPGDLISDDFAGIGIMDDAAILRLAARDAVAAGASGDALRRLATEAEDLAYVFGDLVVKLEEILALVQRPNPEGRTPVDVIADPERRMALWRQINESRTVARAHAQAVHDVDTTELVRSMRHAIRRRLEGRDERD